LRHGGGKGTQEDAEEFPGSRVKDFTWDQHGPAGDHAVRSIQIIYILDIELKNKQMHGHFLSKFLTFTIFTIFTMFTIFTIHGELATMIHQYL
jgi:hypothetical protein